LTFKHLDLFGDWILGRGVKESFPSRTIQIPDNINASNTNDQNEGLSRPNLSGLKMIPLLSL